MSDEKIVDFAAYLARRGRTWADDCEQRALRAFVEENPDFGGFCVAAFDDVKQCACVLLGHRSEARVVARFNIGKNDKLRRVKPTKGDHRLLARYMAGVVFV